MRIVKRKDLLESKPGTIFSALHHGTGEPWIFVRKASETSFKYDNLTANTAMIMSDAHVEILNRAAITGEDVIPEVDLDMEDDGYDDDLFVVWSKEQTLKMIEVLARSLNVGRNTDTALVINANSEFATITETVMLNDVKVLNFHVPSPSGNVYTSENTMDAVQNYKARVARGAARGELGNPKIRPGESQDSFAQRLMSIAYDNVALNINCIGVREDGIYADVQMCGPMGTVFLDLWNKGLCQFAMRSFTDGFGEQLGKVETIVAFDVGPVHLNQPEFQPKKEVANEHHRN